MPDFYRPRDGLGRRTNRRPSGCRTGYLSAATRTIHHCPDRFLSRRLVLARLPCSSFLPSSEARTARVSVSGAVGTQTRLRTRYLPRMLLTSGACSSRVSSSLPRSRGASGCFKTSECLARAPFFEDGRSTSSVHHEPCSHRALALRTRIVAANYR